MLKKAWFMATLVACGVLAPAALAGASTTDPSLDIADFAGDAVGLMFPIVIALVAAALGLAVLMFGVRKVFAMVRKGGKVA